MKFRDMLKSEIEMIDEHYDLGINDLEKIDELAMNIEHDGKFTEAYMDLMRETVIRIAKELNIPIKEED